MYEVKPIEAIGSEKRSDLWLKAEENEFPQESEAGEAKAGASDAKTGQDGENATKENPKLIAGSYPGDPTSVKYVIHKDTGKITIEVISNQTGKVVQEIPPDSVLDALNPGWKTKG